LNSEFDFQEGDVIVAVIKLVSFAGSGNCQIILNRQPAGWSILQHNDTNAEAYNPTVGDERTLTATITAQNITDGVGAIRIRQGNTSDEMVFDLLEFTITRP
jgi:hypothetical protein